MMGKVLPTVTDPIILLLLSLAGSFLLKRLRCVLGVFRNHFDLQKIYQPEGRVSFPFLVERDIKTWLSRE